jgi:hypothetical protein
MFVQDKRTNPSVKVRLTPPCSYFSTFDFEMYAVPLFTLHARNTKCEYAFLAGRIA